MRLFKELKMWQAFGLSLSGYLYSLWYTLGIEQFEAHRGVFWFVFYAIIGFIKGVILCLMIEKSLYNKKLKELI
jgi:hypothetical protein